MERISLVIDEFRREYLFQSVSGSGSPLVVYLHGKGATAEWADDETGLSILAEKEGFSLAIPEALRPQPGSPSRFLSNPQQWNDGSSASLSDMPHADDVSFLTAVIKDAELRAGTDPRRVFVSGFSNGATMAFRLTAELAERVAAVAPVAGYCFVERKLVRPIPTLYLIGSEDPLVPIRGGEVRSPWLHRSVRRPPVLETLERWASCIGCETIPRTETVSGNVRTDIYPGPVPFRVLTIKGMGHHWPGGKGRLNPRIAGTPSDAVNATELVWEFFQQHSL